MPKRRDGLPVIAAEVVAGATISDGADEDRFPGTVVVAGVALGRRAVAVVVGERHEVKDGGGEVADFAPVLASDIASHRQRFQIDFWAGHGATDIQIHAPFELFDRVCEDQEVGEARLTERRAVAVWQTMDDVAADADVAGAGNADPPARGGDAQIAMRESPLFDDSADCLAEPFASIGRFADDVIQASGFLP